MPDRVDRLREAAQARHEATLRRATNALQRLARRGEPVTFRRLAETAGVSRSWLYRQPQLRDEITRLRDTTTGAREPCPPPSGPPPTRSASNCGPTATRSPGCGPRTRNSATNSPDTSAPPVPQQPPQAPTGRHLSLDRLPAPESAARRPGRSVT